MFQVGDFVRGKENNGYAVTNEKMLKGLVVGVKGYQIKVKVLEHVDSKTGAYFVDPEKFEYIGRVKPFDRDGVFRCLADGDQSALLEYDLTNADLTDAKLTNAKLTNADLTNAKLRGADLTGANLTGANLTNADLTNADLTNADLTNADLTNADLTNARLTDADLTGADLTIADLTNAKLTSADLTCADLTSADLTSADLTDAKLTGADLTNAKLRGANLCGADIDYASWPLWCGSIGVKVDKRIACQLAYHLCAVVCDDPEYIQMRNSILDFANQFHRVEECGTLKPIKIEEETENE